jgi:uncharacterized RDD family membrane protein YckC
MSADKSTSEAGEPLEGEIVEASLARPVEGSPGNGAADAVFDVGERVVAPLLRVGWRGVRGIGRRLGLNDAVERAVDRGVDRALESDAVEQTADRVLGSDAAMRVWTKVLESEEAQLLVERVADAPEVRSAIASQGVGLLEDIRQGLRELARRLDTGVERVAKRVLRRQPRDSRPLQAGVVTRGAALLLDSGIVYGLMLLISAALALIASVLDLGDQGADRVVIVGGLLWLLAGAIYLTFFWAAAGRTPGMAFLGIRMTSLKGGPVRPGQAVRRVVWFNVSILALGLGFWGVLYEQRRRGWPDRRGRTLVLYADPKLDGDLSGWTEAAAPASRPRAAR